MRRALALAALLHARAFAGDYDSDDLCRAIGETPNIAVGPRDRLYFQKNCACVPGLGCAAAGSELMKAMRAAYDAETARRDDERKAAAARERRAAAERKVKQAKLAKERAQREKEEARLAEEQARLDAIREKEEAAARKKEAAERERLNCEKYVECLARFSANECGLVRERMEESCIERGGVWGDCTFERAKAIAEKKSCESIVPALAHDSQ